MPAKRGEGYFVSTSSHFRASGTIHKAVWYKIRTHWEYYIPCREGRHYDPQGALTDDIQNNPAPFCKICFRIELQESIDG